VRGIADGPGHDDATVVLPARDVRQVSLTVGTATLDDVLDVVVEQQLQLLGHGGDRTGRDVQAAPSESIAGAQARPPRSRTTSACTGDMLPVTPRAGRRFSAGR
jgi:hypothetical protein